MANTQKRSADQTPPSLPTPNGELPEVVLDAEAEVSNGADDSASKDYDADIRALWTDDGLNDPLTTEHFHKIPIGKPKDFFRVHPAKEYRRKCEILVLRPENSVGEEYYLIGPKMLGKIDEARPCTLITVV